MWDCVSLLAIFFLRSALLQFQFSCENATDLLDISEAAKQPMVKGPLPSSASLWRLLWLIYAPRFNLGRVGRHIVAAVTAWFLFLFQFQAAAVNGHWCVHSVHSAWWMCVWATRDETSQRRVGWVDWAQAEWFQQVRCLSLSSLNVCRSAKSPLAAHFAICFGARPQPPPTTAAPLLWPSADPNEDELERSLRSLCDLDAIRN